MNTKHLLTSAALIALIPAAALAHNPTGRHATGTIEVIDPNTQQLTFRADDATETRAFTWNEQTRFVREIRFVPATAAQRGSRAEVIYHTPFFGEAFVSKITVLNSPAPNRRSRK